MDRRNRLSRSKSDGLSSLPDEVLCHVLSFLPTKLSVATSILATRYRYLWRDVVDLDFDDYEHHYREYYFENPPQKISFSEGINKVLLLRSNLRDINTFRLLINSNSSSQEHQLDTWIRYVIARNVQAIDIEFFPQPEHRLPSCLFTCRTLVDLRLRYFGCGVHDNIFLPNLKKLHLRNFKYGSDEKFQDLISGCPVLEELNIEEIRSSDMRYCIISSPTIKWLTLDFVLEEGEYEIWDYKLKINTPELRYLRLTDNLSKHICAGVFNSLVEASIILLIDEVQDNNISSDSMLEFVERLCQVKCLKLLSFHNQFLDSSFAAVTSKFNNLTKLELGAYWHFLIKFLEIADNLQVLIIRELDYNLECWTEPQQVPACLSSNLRQVTVDEFGRGSENEFEMVSYILKHGKVLNEVKINAKHLRTDVEKLNALQRISEFERGSQTCKVKFSGDGVGAAFIHLQ